MAVNNVIKRIQNVLRNEQGINGDAQRIEQLVWMFFLKVYDTLEETWEYNDENYVSIIPEELRWRNWAVDKNDGKTKTGAELLKFVNDDLFVKLKNLNVNFNTPRSKAIVKEVFEDINQYMKDGTILRQVINIINEIEFDDAQDRHLFGDIYENILKSLQSAGNAGEFYTPRALTDLIVTILNPQLGETFADFASGTGGFLTSALKHLKLQMKNASVDAVKYQEAVRGQEWKPLPYLLSITNLLLHDIEAPNIIHCDSLATSMSDFTEADMVDVIAMNPPYGGSTGTGVKSNFPTDLRSSETADLFIVLIMYRLKEKGRVGVIIPDGFLFGTDGAKLAIKTKLLKEFNLHTIIRLPRSIFSPYTPLATNILFFNKDKAKDAPDGWNTKETWFYRLDMPEGYKHFSKTKPMKLEHCQSLIEWWNARVGICDDDGNDKARLYSVKELIDNGYNFDLCKFSKKTDEVLAPAELLEQYYEQRSTLEREINSTLDEIQKMLGLNKKDII